MGWIDTIIVSGIIIFGLVILYRALKEPIDMFFGLIAKLFGYTKDKLVDTTDSGYDVIRYG